MTRADDPVNHPRNYAVYKGLEVIDLAEQLNFNRGNAVKYICRAGLKDPATEVEDLQKACWYIEREIKRIWAGHPDTVRVRSDGEALHAHAEKKYGWKSSTS